MTIHDRPFRSLSLVLLSLPLIWCWMGVNVRATDSRPPRFCLVGLGPGDPDLMTIRARKTIEESDVIFCSRHWSEKLGESLEGKQVYHDYWRLFPYYGSDPSEFEGEERRRCEEYHQKQAEFATLVRNALAEGKNVAMLDGGDPLVYGPCAWVLEELEDLNPQVIPGVSCFNAANAALRRGVTTSDRTKSVILTAADWLGTEDTIEKMSVHRTTMVLFTMRTEFEEFIDKLSINYPPETPIAVVKHAGYAEKEAVVETTLGKALDEIDAKNLPFEYLIYVGNFLNHRYNRPKASPAAGSSE